MKKTILTIAVIIGLSFSLNSKMFADETNVANKQFYCEFLGPGDIMSINFDSRFKSNSNQGLGYRLGVGIGAGIKDFWKPMSYYFLPYYLLLDYEIDVHYDTKTFVTFPFGLNYIIGKKNANYGSSLEVGGGATFISHKEALYYYDYNNTKKGNFIGHLTFMYRYVPLKSGISVRAGLTPIIGTSGDLCPIASISIGYAFSKLY